jgi:hypothetical protein
MCKACGKWHDLDQPWPCALKLRRWIAPNVISDSMEPTKHHATGQMISSKRAFSRETRRAGCVEIGNEVVKPRQFVKLDRGQRRDAIRKTIYQLKNGYIDKSGD